MNKGNTHYETDELFFIKKSFKAGKSDAAICDQLACRYGRKLKPEAMRKIRRKLGLKKIPSFER